MRTSIKIWFAPQLKIVVLIDKSRLSKNGLLAFYLGQYLKSLFPNINFFLSKDELDWFHKSCKELKAKKFTKSINIPSEDPIVIGNSIKNILFKLS